MKRAYLLVVSAVLLAACGGGAEPASAPPAGISTRVPEPTAAAPRTPAPVVTPSAASRSWAEAICAATADFDEAVIAVQDDIDPRTLSLEDRRARGVARYEAYREAAAASVASLDGVTPPAGASTYHRAVIAQFQEVDRLLAEQIAILEQAQSHEDIEAANQLIALEMARLENSVRLASSVLDSDAIRALRAAPRCGQLLG
jgi:hypothetical protein